jgi:hypothetical protein
VALNVLTEYRRLSLRTGKGLEGEVEMEEDQVRMNGACRRCGSTEAFAAADAQAIGLRDDFLAGLYTCCQVVQWADEQWVAWQDAACEDGKPVEEATSPLEVEPEARLVPVRVRKPKP